jgi:hypothetical protein
MKHLWTQYIKPLVIWLIQGIAGFAVIVFFAVMFAEWAAGCGETYVDSKGRTHINECILVPSYNNTKGDKTSPNT